MTLSRWGGPGRHQGRKPLHGVPMVALNARITVEQKEYLMSVGGARWLRATISKAMAEANEAKTNG